MTANETIWQLPDQTIAADDTSPPTLNPPGILRSSSDSVVNSKKRRPAQKLIHFHDRKSTSKECPPPRDDVTVDTIEQGTLVVAARALPPSRAPSQPKIATLLTKAKKQHLQLPSFQALGIANPYPISILTPPDEPSSLSWASSDTDHDDLTPTAANSTPSNLLTTNAHQRLFPTASIRGASNNNSTPTQASVDSLISPSVPSQQQPGSNSSSSSTATEVASNMPWLNQALGTVCEW